MPVICMIGRGFIRKEAEARTRSDGLVTFVDLLQGKKRQHQRCEHDLNCDMALPDQMASAAAVSGRGPNTFFDGRAVL